MKSRLVSIGCLATHFLWASCTSRESPGERTPAREVHQASVPASQPDSTPPTPGAFGFADSTGFLVITVAPGVLDDPGRLNRAACGGNAVLDVTFVEQRSAGARSTGRDVAQNFDQLAGYLFRVTNRRAAPDQTCLLLDSVYASTWTISSHTTSGDSTCGPDLLARLAAAKQGRAVIQCRRLVEAAGGREVAVAQFETRGNDALASLVFVAPGALALEDFPGSGQEGSTWRVDDEGVFDTAAFDVLGVLESAGGGALAYAWAGAEGESIALVVVEGTRLRRVLEGYRYWSPA